MRRAHRSTYAGRAGALCALLLALALPSSGAASQSETALDRYVAKPDSHYSYKLIKSHKADGLTAHVLEMTSQKWLTEKEVDKPLWKHWVTIIQPDEVSSETGFLFIAGGSNDKSAPDKLDQNLAKVAAATRSVVTELRMVPNQPLVFHGDGKPRYEDDLIAYTWDQYLRTGDERWPARLPMTKSAVRAMDTVTSFCASEKGGKVTVNKFVVAGGSKRGWTTWATAIVDDRVAAIAPMVIDLLNVVTSFKHHYAAYGFWAPAVGDYERHGIMEWVDTPEYAALMKIEDPYEYRDRLTMPKMIINSAGDQFFLPDSTQFYWDELKGQNFVRYVPNSDHSLKNTDALTGEGRTEEAITRDERMVQLAEPGKRHLPEAFAHGITDHQRSSEHRSGDGRASNRPQMGAEIKPQAAAGKGP